jgi:thymidylate synthase
MEQINRTPHEFPTIKITNVCENIDDYKEEMFVIDNYKFHETIKMIMRK